MRLSKPNKLLISTAAMLATCVIASCGAGSASNSSSHGAGSASGSSPQSPNTSSVRFDSPEYGYSLTIPAGWNTNQAYSKWDGKTEITVDSLEVDRFFDAGSRVSFAAAAPWTHSLASYAKYLISYNARYHSDTCPRRPKRQTGIEIGSTPGVLLEYNCGILINIAAAVRHGVGYVFVFKDDGVDASFDPTDHALFTQMLGSVTFLH